MLNMKKRFLLSDPCSDGEQEELARVLMLAKRLGPMMSDSGLEQVKTLLPKSKNQLLGISAKHTPRSPSGFQVKDAREKLVQKDARFKIRGRGGAGGVQDARQMINSRKQGQKQFGLPAQTSPKMAVTHHLQSPTIVPQIQIQTNNNLAGVNSRQYNPNIQGLSARASVTPQLSNNKRMIDARDRLSLKRSIGGTQTQAGFVPPLKITKTIQVRLNKLLCS